MSENITKYNLEYKGVLCTGVQWGYGKFFFTKDGKEYEFDQTKYIQCVADTDYIRCVIEEQFLPWLKDERIKELKAENAALRERLEKAIEIPFVFNKKVFVIVYDKKGNPYLFEGIVTGIGTDTNKLYEGEIDLLMSVVNECGETHFINGKQYRKQWFCEDEIEAAEARLAEIKGEVT